MADRDRPDDDNGWQEPAHLSGDDSGDDSDRPNIADRRRTPREEGSSWTPPGWDLPAAERDVPAAERDVTGGLPPVERGAAPGERELPPGGRAPSGDDDPDLRPVDRAPGPDAGQQPAGPAWGLGGRRGAPRPPTDFERTFAYQGDLEGTQAWAVAHGWSISDGTAPEDAGLAALVASAPAPRISKDSRAAGVIRGRADALDLVAFDVVFEDRGRFVPQYAITAAPLLVPVPYVRISPARLWRHRTGGLVHLPTGDEHFDRRWVLAAAEDSPQARRLAADPAVRAALLGTDDGDELWAAAGHVSAIRPDGHRPLLLEHHARLLTVVVRALAG